MSKKRNNATNKNANSTRSGNPTGSINVSEKLIKLMELINSEGIDCAGYHSLDQDPTIVTACKRFASMVGLISWHLMVDQEDGGDIRIKNELSRKIDINPNSYMTRQKFYSAIAMNLLLYGDGNAVVRPHTENGYLRDLEIIPMNRVTFLPDPMAPNYKYTICIDGVPYDPRDLIHFAINTDNNYPWRGKSFRVAIADVAENLHQAAKTEKAFNKSKWKPPIIIKVDSISSEFHLREVEAQVWLELPSQQGLSGGGTRESRDETTGLVKKFVRVFLYNKMVQKNLSKLFGLPNTY